MTSLPSIQQYLEELANEVIRHINRAHGEALENAAFADTEDIQERAIAKVRATIVATAHHLELREEAVKRETEKAFGGCTNCYGKGYATVQEYASGYDTDTDIGSPGGKVFFAQSPIKYCTCERGKQLKKTVASLSKPVTGKDHA